MRPIRLVMQAFGPYAQTQVLEMDRLGETGIYAITGETGAGKTTIFDAIVYALYGSGSGEDRKDSKGLRAVAASPDLETRVELEFVSGGKRYRIERKPKQLLTGKRKSGLVEQPASQVLTMPDGKRYTSDREIQAQIEEDVLGVTKEQFCQIVMIAQGEFRKLLRAGTDERTVILRRIFKTERYRAIGKRMKELCRDRSGAYDDSRKQASFALNAMRVEATSPLYEALEAMKRADPAALSLESAAEIAEQIAKADAADQEAAGQALATAEKARDAARQALEHAREQQKKRDMLAALNKTLADMGERLDEARRARDAAESERPRIEALAAAIAAETATLPKYESLKALDADCRQIDVQLKQAQRDLESACSLEGRIEKEKSALEDEARRLSDAPECLLESSADLAAQREAGKRLAALNARVEAREAASKACEENRAAGVRAEADARAAAEALAEITGQIEALGNTELSVQQAEDAQLRLEEARREIDRLSKLHDDYLEAQSRYADACAQYHACEQHKAALCAEAAQLRSRYNANLAGIWARDLVEGAPCPVCGSTNHPNKARLNDDLSGAALTEASVNEAEARAAEAERIFNAQAVECSGLNAARESLQRQVEALLPDIAPAQWAAEIERRLEANAAEQRNAEEALRRATAADARLHELNDKVLPAARLAAEEAENARIAAEHNSREASLKLEAAEREVALAAEGCMPEGWTTLDLSDAVAQNAARTESLERQYSQACADSDRLKQIDAQMAELSSRQKAASDARHDEDRRIAELAARMQERAREAEALRGELPYPAEADCRTSIEQKSRQKESLERAIDETRQAAVQLENEQSSAKGQIRLLEAELEGCPVPDLPALETQLAELQAKCDGAAKIEKAVHTRRTNNADRRAQLLAQSEAARALEHEYRVMKEVSDTANGEVTGKERLSLETYVQTAYFDRIISYANRRLIHMSRHQYELARQDAGDGGRRSQTGLNLDVIDHANGQRRPVSTLSGGESFLASLSFALGMSDAIQASATSAVQLDTMFVDEGFGSLSDNYLELVMDELNDTANAGHRLIGIISHVDEVKEGVDRRIEVTKTVSGVSRAAIR